MLSQLKSALGEANVLTRVEQIASYCTDWTGQFTSHPIAVVRPRQAEQVVDVLRIASEFDVAVVTQGGNTSLVGGSVGGDWPHIILSTSGLREVLDFDAAAQQVVVSAGFTLAEVQKFAASHGLEYPVDLAARDSATIGGTVATNAGGIRVVAHGMTRAHVVGLELVLSDGEVLDHLNPLVKDNTGPDITSLAVGSEGTLGVITAVRLQLKPLRTSAWTALVPVEKIDDAIAFASMVGTQLLAAEVFLTRSGNEVARAHGLPLLENKTEWWLLVEGDEEFPDHLDLPSSTLLATQQSDVERLWKYRELHTAIISQRASVLKLDVSVPLERLSDFLAQTRNAALNVGIQDDAIYFFGHVMDGNVHISLADVALGGSTLADEIVELVVECGGAISAEHGVGRLKGKYLPLVRTGRELALFAEVRQAFDPAGILNPHVLRP